MPERLFASILNKDTASQIKLNSKPPNHYFAEEKKSKILPTSNSSSPPIRELQINSERKGLRQIQSPNDKTPKKSIFSDN